MQLRALILAGGLLGSAACGPSGGEHPNGDEPERYAEAACTAIESCGCYQFFDDEDRCESELRDRFRSLLDRGLTIDLDCFEHAVEDLDDCTAVDSTPSEWRCIVLRGDKVAGDPCEDRYLDLPPFGIEECEAPLFCSGGVCRNEHAPELAEGSPCVGGATSCGSDGPTDLYCSPAGACEHKFAEGEPCDSPWSCGFAPQADGTGLYCAGYDAGVCTRNSLVGESCNPSDYNPCVEGPDLDTHRAWCDPAQGVCVAEGPGICHVTDFPNARSTSP